MISQKVQNYIEEHAFCLNQLYRIADGGKDNVQHRIKRDKRNQKQYQDIEDCECFFTLSALQRHTFSPPLKQTRLVETAADGVGTNQQHGIDYRIE